MFTGDGASCHSLPARSFLSGQWFLLLPLLPSRCNLRLPHGLLLLFCLFLTAPQGLSLKQFLSLRSPGWPTKTRAASEASLKRMQPCPFISLQSPRTCENCLRKHVSERVFLGFKAAFLGQKESGICIRSSLKPERIFP